MALLEIQNLNRRFGGLQAVNNVSFTVEQGMIKAVIGPNGAGKTTLFNLIAGNLPANSGTIHFNSKRINGLKPYQVAQGAPSRTYQNIKLFHGMTALENVMVGRHIRSRAGFMAGIVFGRLADLFRPTADPSLRSSRHQYLVLTNRGFQVPQDLGRDRKVRTPRRFLHSRGCGSA